MRFIFIYYRTMRSGLSYLPCHKHDVVNRNTLPILALTGILVDQASLTSLKNEILEIAEGVQAVGDGIWLVVLRRLLLKLF